MGKAKADSIEHHLRDKEIDLNSRANPQVENDFRAKYGKQNEVIDKNFELSNSEFVIDHYACAHYGKIPKQGRLFITPKFILFFANILGKKVKKKIPFELIEDIKKESVTLLAVSPIEIQLKYKRFTFVSFLHREKAFNNLLLQWKANKDGKPYVIRIPLEDEDDGEEGESASLSHNQANEPTDEPPKIEVQSMWEGNSQGAILGEELVVEESSRKGTASTSQQPKLAPNPAPPQKISLRGTLSAMPKMYSTSTDKKRSCCGCLPWCK